MEKILTAVAALTALIAASATLAQGGPGGPVSYASLDADEDGKVTLDEFKENFSPPPREGRTPDPVRIFGRWDANGDGELTAEEFENRPRRQGQ
jgi:hypothetical protein